MVALTSKRCLKYLWSITSEATTALTPSSGEDVGIVDSFFSVPLYPPQMPTVDAVGKASSVLMEEQ